VVGGTGILRPAALALAAQGRRVTVLARGARDEPGTGLSGAPADATDMMALAAALDAAIAARGPLALALVYAPFAPAAAQAAVARRVPGTLVHVLTSRWSAPGVDPGERDAWAPDGPGPTRRLLLGWAVEADGTTRWHTPAEVSAAALSAAHSAQRESALGALRPWSDRPR
jgi:hypothetical protein